MRDKPTRSIIKFNMTSNFFSRYNSFYFIGICGVSMSALAAYALSLGKRVGGSDRDLSESGRLKSIGAALNCGGTRALVGYDAVVYTDAVAWNDEELRLARTVGKPVISRGKLLAEMSKNFRRTLAVCGCHGKTTCTAMLASVFFCAGKRFAAHIGGYSKQFSNFFYNGNDLFVTEACEYKKNFLHLDPDIAVVLNTDADHLECYRGAGELEECYLRFASRAQTAVVPYGSGLAASLGGEKVTFGGEGADFAAVDERCTGGRSSFVLSVRGRRVGRVCLSVYGAHNVLNALAAAAAADAEGIGEGDIISGLEHFTGTARRMERIGRLHGAECFADYAHHPAEIAAAVKTARGMAEGRLYVVFQPHTYSRTKNLFGEFVSALSLAERLLVYRTFAAREYFDGEGSALSLAAAVRGAAYGDRAEDISEFASSAGEGDLLLFLGAGDIYRIAKGMVS